MAAEHIHRGEPFLPNLPDPVGEIGAVTRLNSVNHEPRKEEVVKGVAVLGELLVSLVTVPRVDFRKKSNPEAVRALADSRQILPGSRLVEEVTRADFLVEIGEGVEPHNPAAVGGELFQGGVVEIPNHRGLGV